MMSGQMKEDFISLANTVFGAFVTEEYYKAKYENNIYGPSLLTVVYVDGYPAGTDIMWRNDLHGERAYQTVDTGVLVPFRGMGLFKKLSCHELDYLGQDTLVYGFPNVNSYPGYVKMGWHVSRLYKTPVLFNRSLLNKETIDSNYAAWWLKAQQGISHIRKNGAYYLIRTHKNSPVATLIGRVEEQVAKLFPRTSGCRLLKCFDNKQSIYNENKSIPLVCNDPNKEIPYWRIDAI